MARLNAKQQLNGLIGPVYVRNLNGKSVVQTRPSGRKKSKGTKASGESFTRAVAQSRAIRVALSPLLVQGTDSYVSQRLTGALQKAYHQPLGATAPLTFFTADLNSLTGFEFHKHTPLTRYIPIDFPFEIVDDGSLKLASTAVPVIDTKQLPDSGASCGLAIMVTAWQPEANVSPTTEVFGFELQRQGPTLVELQTTAYLTGTRFVVAAQLLAWNNLTVLGDKNYCNAKEFNPVSVVFTGVV